MRMRASFSLLLIAAMTCGVFKKRGRETFSWSSSHHWFLPFKHWFGRVFAQQKNWIWRWSWLAGKNNIVIVQSTVVRKKQLLPYLSSPMESEFAINKGKYYVGQHTRVCIKCKTWNKGLRVILIAPEEKYGSCSTVFKNNNVLTLKWAQLFWFTFKFGRLTYLDFRLVSCLKKQTYMKFKLK